MKIRHYRAADMRTALAQVRDALGADAIILSSRRNGSEVEVVAAIDDPRLAQAAPPVKATPTAPPPSASAGSTIHEELALEVRRMRQMLESQLALLVKSEARRDAPVQLAVLRELTEIGITVDLAAGLVDQLPAELDFGSAVRCVLDLLARQIPVLQAPWLDRGGRIMLVGPSGAGKTTVLAKLAAHWILRNGQSRIALVSADATRIGAHDQLQSLGRLLGVRTQCVDRASELGAVLEMLSDFDLVLVDTAGISLRDDRSVNSLGEMRAAQSQLQTVIVAACNAQTAVIENLIARSAALQPVACIITKLDEAARLGGALAAVVRTKIPVAYVCEGPRVPEDLVVARARELVMHAQRLVGNASSDSTRARSEDGVAANAAA
ncbi:MAG TPA: flagellar biosynthesis protein FlhF [Steroidobacteraceae bacterium]|nr:flagellar biosynthesis protein FlhF [Steroidobacteraceae bacterium]HRX90624.1 flagellar biosynthesis protein FlhF [Steroidobacteraceae bacterium]